MENMKKEIKKSMTMKYIQEMKPKMEDMETYIKI